MMITSYMNIKMSFRIILAVKRDNIRKFFFQKTQKRASSLCEEKETMPPTSQLKNI